MSTSRPYRIALFGAAPDTPNMGVSALFFSAISGLAGCLDDVEFVVFDHGLRRREKMLQLPTGKKLRLILFGARGGHRYFRAENLASMFFASRFGALGSLLNEGVRLIDTCDAVMDASGGDSFSDIYGEGRFNNVFRPKAIAINRGKPLILLPQTYGPYIAKKLRGQASRAVTGAAMAWARDAHSYKILQDLLGTEFNPEIHKCGVDMAFGLPALPAIELLMPPLSDWVRHKKPEVPLVGFNVSGLIYNDPESATQRFGFKADYRRAVITLLEKILAESNACVTLISHVMDRPGHFESDLAACEDVYRQLPERYRHRVAVAPANLDQSQVKWLISQMDWFCGTRMHSTIAGLSSGVPTAAISYSDKTKGVFDTCGQVEQVFDPRKLDTDSVIVGLWGSYVQRRNILDSLSLSLQLVRETAEMQMASIAEGIRSRAVAAAASS